MTSSIRYMLPLGLLAAICSSFLISCGDSSKVESTTKDTSDSELRTKVLYVTHEPGKYHDYTAQRAIFDTIAHEQPWDVTILSATHDELVERLAGDPDFGKKADVIIYNICMAKELNLMVPYNIMRQTTVHGKPALLIHCTLHSFWATFKADPNKGGVHTPGAHPKAHSMPETITQWQEAHPDKNFPAWTNFTGIASIKHSPKSPVQSIKKLHDHPILTDVGEYTSAEKSELYYNFITEEEASNTTGILLGRVGEDEDFILWEKQHPKAKVVSYTMGHSTEEWHEEPFQVILANAINYLAKDAKKSY